MNNVIINGKEIAEKLIYDLSKTIKTLKFKPSLAIIQVGNNKASNIYIKNKIKKCSEVGIQSILIKMPKTVTEASLIEELNKLNNNTEVHGIIIQLPLPKTINYGNIINIINPDKDVDGFHPENLGKLLTNQDSLVPCTPEGCMILIKSKIKNLSGKKAVVIGRSNIVGKPLSYMLLKENCTVTMAHSNTVNLKSETKTADILVVAIGKSEFIKADLVKKGALVIDVGISYTQNGITGDVDFENVKQIASHITKVPGGVGPMTIACLLKNTVKAAIKLEEQKHKND